ncbi:IS3 family transposase, partial [Thiolapillus sp.]
FLNVSRSGFYDWQDAPKTEREKENEELIEQLGILFQEGRGTYGTRRLKRKLKEVGYTVSRRRISRLMKRAGLVCKTKRKFRVTTDSKHKQPIAPNLLERQFTVDKPKQTYVGDITSIETQEGWLYLAVVIDLYSRQVVGWSMDKRMQAKLVNDAFLMAIWKAKPAKGLIW